MICTEVAEMYEFFRKVIAPVGAAAILAALFYPLCVENGQCDYLKLWIFMGIPFGVHKMFLWIIPKRGSGKSEPDYRFRRSHSAEKHPSWNLCY